jgi:16S rRNA (cytosine1402-N4)-methyltransferase
VAIDCTLGAAGHTRLLLERVGSTGRVLAIDHDAAAIERARETLRSAASNLILAQGDFADVAEIASHAGVEAAGAILFDLGISSDQLDDPERGFSFRREGPLDMRMDPRSDVTAEDLVNSLPERELAETIRTFGEERWAARIASFIVQRRPMRTTAELRAAVEAAVPRAAWPRDIHPATRTFQALRIRVNDELGSLRRGLEGAVDVLAPGGRVAVISFHSLEDGAVKRFFQQEARGCICPPEQPVCTCGHVATLRIVTRKPVRPSAEEVASNPRSRSSRLRVAERLAAPGA